MGRKTRLCCDGRTYGARGRRLGKGGLGSGRSLACCAPLSWGHPSSSSRRRPQSRRARGLVCVIATRFLSIYYCVIEVPESSMIILSLPDSPAPDLPPPSPRTRTGPASDVHPSRLARNRSSTPRARLPHALLSSARPASAAIRTPFHPGPHGASKAPTSKMKRSELKKRDKGTPNGQGRAWLRE